MYGICVAVNATTSVSGVVSVDDVEVVEVAACGSHDQDTTRHGQSPFRRGSFQERVV